MPFTVKASCLTVKLQIAVDRGLLASKTASWLVTDTDTLPPPLLLKSMQIRIYPNQMNILNNLNWLSALAT
jgi:hypothetical protein